MMLFNMIVLDACRGVVACECCDLFLDEINLSNSFSLSISLTSMMFCCMFDL